MKITQNEGFFSRDLGKPKSTGVLTLCMSVKVREFTLWSIVTGGAWVFGAAKRQCLCWFC